MELKIDPEFEKMIPPLTDAEFKQLRDNILEDGEILNPIITWQGFVVDGHNRFKILQENPSIPYKTHEMIFLNRYEVKEWICKNQLGRRNITNEQRLRLIGQMQENRKKSHGNNAKRDDTGKYLMGQNEPTGDKPKSTAAQIAEEVGVSESTVKRAEKFSKGIDVLQEVAPEAAERVLKGNSGVTKAQIMDLPKMGQKDRKAFAEQVMNPQPKERSKEEKPESLTGDLNELIKDISEVGNELVCRMKEILVKNSTTYVDTESRKIVLQSISEIKQKIEGIEKLLI